MCYRLLGDLHIFSKLKQQLNAMSPLQIWNQRLPEFWINMVICLLISQRNFNLKCLFSIQKLLIPHPHFRDCYQYQTKFYGLKMYNCTVARICPCLPPKQMSRFKAPAAFRYSSFLSLYLCHDAIYYVSYVIYYVIDFIRYLSTLNLIVS